MSGAKHTPGNPVPIRLMHENGKAVTVSQYGSGGLAVIAWRKSGAPLLCLRLEINEARELRAELDAAISKAAGSAA